RRSLALQCCGLLDCAQNAVVAAAATDVVVKRAGDLGAGRRRIAVEQRLRRDEDAAQAIAALAGLLVEQRPLQRMRPLGRAEALDGGDPLAGHAPDRLGAGFCRRAVDQHHAAAALLEPAAEPRADEAELVAQHGEQRGLLVRHRHADGAVVDAEIEARHRCPYSWRMSYSANRYPLCRDMR